MNHHRNNKINKKIIITTLINQQSHLTLENFKDHSLKLLNKVAHSLLIIKKYIY